MNAISKIEQKLMKSREAHRQLEAQAAALRAKEKERERQRQRSDDARRKVVIGAIVLEQWKSGNCTILDLKELLDAKVIATSDRLLFGLKVLSESTDAIAPIQVKFHDLLDESSDHQSTVQEVQH